MGIGRLVGWLVTNAVALAVACQLFDGIGFEGGATSGWAEVQDKLGPLLFVALIDLIPDGSGDGGRPHPSPGLGGAIALRLR